MAVNSLLFSIRIIVSLKKAEYKVGSLTDEHFALSLLVLLKGN